MQERGLMLMYAPHIRDQRARAVGIQRIFDILLRRKDYLQPLCLGVIEGGLSHAACNQDLAIKDRSEQSGAALVMIFFLFVGVRPLVVMMVRFLARFKCNIFRIIQNGNYVELSFAKMAADGFTIIGWKRYLFHTLFLN